MPWNHEITARNESPRTPSVLSRHSRATTSHPKANIGLRVRNRHLKSARRNAFPGRKQALVKDDRKSFGEKLRVLSRYTFYRRILQKPSWKIRFSAILSKIRKTGISELRNFLRRRPFGRPIPVWGPAAVGEAPRSVEHRIAEAQKRRSCTQKYRTLHFRKQQPLL